MALGDGGEALWQGHCLVTVAHPHVDRGCGQVGEELGGGHDVDGHAAVLAAMHSGLDLATQQVGDHLQGTREGDGSDARSVIRFSAQLSMCMVSGLLAIQQHAVGRPSWHWHVAEALTLLFLLLLQWLLLLQLRLCATLPCL